MCGFLYLGLSEGVCNHFTAEVSPGRFLVIPYGMSWAEVTATSLLLVDERGVVLRGGGPELPAAAANYENLACPGSMISTHRTRIKISSVASGRYAPC